MTARLPLASLLLSCAAIAGAYGLAFLPGGAPPLAAWGLALGSAGALSSTMALGAMRTGRLRPIALLACVLTFLVVGGAFAVVLLLPPAEGASATLVLGLPLRTAIVLYGVGVVPMLFLPLAYAASFDSDTLNEADIERVRRAAPERTP
ncbi:MAG TPA: hypothetical protein VGJ96_15090 [Gemmatimonadaceae bacterium]|jgi:hypothetical protein